MEQCLECGELNLKRNGSKYCSDKCRNKTKYVDRNCKQCGDSIRGTKRKTFCSDKCSKKWFLDHKEKKDNPFVIKTCKVCGATFETNINKIFCSDKCRVTNQRNEAKQTRGEVRKMFSEREFKEYVIQDSDKIDFSMKDLSNYKYFPSKIKQQMIMYKITPRLAKQETSTIRGIWRRKSSVINIAELIELYNIKVEKFRNYPQLNVFNSIIGISKTIDYARRKWNEKL